MRELARCFGCDRAPLSVLHDLAGVQLEPMAIELLRGDAELDDNSIPASKGLLEDQMMRSQKRHPAIFPFLNRNCFNYLSMSVLTT